MRKTLCALAIAAISVTPIFSQGHDTNPEKYYLVISEVVNSQQLLPAPPDTTTARYAYDREQYEWGKSMRSCERGKRAILDADLSEGWLDRDFSEAFGFKLTPQNAPEIYKLLSTMKEDAGDLATRTAKNHYMRPRPFMVYNEPSATPADEPGLRKNGSFPSGHTAIGWASALVLSEINPARKNEIMQRGYDFGQSRVICGAHFQSDVDAGRLVGSAVVAQLHANKDFQKQLAKAKKELNKLVKQQQKK
ncbi:MAG: phosphatase PAP2 family protein [Muribaculaceae bacterium]|nr:phosphatase PAP2 family protein [Muribaculaceae bacterium]